MPRLPRRRALRLPRGRLLGGRGGRPGITTQGRPLGVRRTTPVPAGTASSRPSPGLARGSSRVERGSEHLLVSLALPPRQNLRFQGREELFLDGLLLGSECDHLLLVVTILDEPATPLIPGLAVGRGLPREIRRGDLSTGIIEITLDLLDILRELLFEASEPGIATQDGFPLGISSVASLPHRQSTLLQQRPDLGDLVVIQAEPLLHLGPQERVGTFDQKLNMYEVHMYE